MISRGCLIKKFPNILPNYAKTINSRVKSQAKCQIYFSRALKWGIVHLCSFNNSRDTMKFRKLLVFQFLHFCKKIVKSLCKIAEKCESPKNYTFCFLSYLQFYLSYRDVQYLILKLLTNSLTFILSIDYRSNQFWDIKKNVSPIFLSIL